MSAARRPGADALLVRFERARLAWCRLRLDVAELLVERSLVAVNWLLRALERQICDIERQKFSVHINMVRLHALSDPDIWKGERR